MVNAAFPFDLLDDDRNVELILVGLWAHSQEPERQLREAPVAETGDEAESNHDRMFN